MTLQKTTRIRERMRPSAIRWAGGAVLLVAAFGLGAEGHGGDSAASCCAPAGRAGLLLQSAEVAVVVAPSVPAADSAGPPAMVWIPGGTFAMGSTDPLARPDEAPVHRVQVDGFWMHRTEVTNAQFAAFVAATGYVTVAERPVDWEELRKQLPEGTPRPPEAMLQPGSLVFSPPDHPVDLRDFSQWWSWTSGASWRHPEGPGSSIEGRQQHPVVHVAHEDAVAFATWIGGTLPTEAQWEFAARGGLEGAVNTWGDEPISPQRANTWEGAFPHQNTAADGFVRTAPVASYPPNGFGLYDMAGNVWEWCLDHYRPDTYARRVLQLKAQAENRGEASPVAINPVGPPRSYDLRNLRSPESRVHRGGSFLCNDSYCASYRPSARMAAPPDTGMQHLGFRCVMAPEAWRQRQGGSVGDS